MNRWVEFDGHRWESDLSLTYSAARGQVRLHRGDGRSEIVGDDVWTVLRGLLDDGLTAVGYLGYACRRDLPARPSPDVPDAVLVLCDSAPRRVVSASAAPGPLGPHSQPEPPDSYRAAFDRVQEALHAGDTYETNLTYRITAVSGRAPEEIRAALEPTPYSGMLVHDVPGASAWLISASPERYARVADGAIETKPIKGTLPRGATATEDAANAERLRTDPRFRAENLMITDLLRNDVGQVCEPGSVEVPALMAVESYASVHQLVTTVRGRLRPGVTALDAVRALFPAGSMTGAPKLRTMELIDRLEATPRGAYAGAFGRLSRDAADLGVVIRSLTSPDGRTWTLGTGGGVTVHSDLEQEWRETRWKAARLLEALGQGGGL